MLQKIKTARWQSRNYEIWKNELPSEVDFWKRWISKDGMPEGWLKEQRQRFDPNTPLQEWIQDLLRAPIGATVRILDVGSGPATTIGKVWAERKVDITALDPLADDYNRLLREYKIKVPVQTQSCAGELVADFVEPDSFDLAYSVNALDHSHNPLKAVQGMVNSVKKGGWVVLEHYINEAEHEAYDGLHQWNFAKENGEFIIWNKQQRLMVRKNLNHSVKVNMEIRPPKETDGKEKLVVLMQKN